MCKRLIYVMTFVLAMGSTAHAALYLWNGSAGDGNWDTVLNWTVTDSLWTWPNEESGGKLVNNDTIGIDIVNGGVVSRGSELAIQGAADGSTTGVLTLNNSSSLTVTGKLATGGADNTRGQIDILGGSTVTILGGEDLRVADSTGSWGTVNIVDSTVDIADDLDLDEGEGYINISGSSTVNVNGDDLIIANTGTAVGYLNISGNAVVTCSDDLMTDDGEGHITITDNAIVNVDDFVIVENDNGVGSLEVSGNATVNIVDDLKIVDDQGGTGSLVVSGNAIITCGDDYFGNDDSGNPSSSTVTLDGGTVIVGDDTTFNDDNPGTATVTINGGSWLGNDTISVSDNLNNTTHVTINGGEMICNNLKLGDSGGDDVGQIRIFLNGGLFQANRMSIKTTDTQIIYTGGLFRIGSGSLDVAGMEQLIADGTIVADGVHSVITNGAYTELNSVSPALAQGPVPADGAEGVLLGTTLSWTAGNTAATHDVYFGTSSPPPLIDNQEASTYYPGPIELGTTYYWQIVEVEADGTTKHASDVWSFTTTTDLSTVSEIATQPNPADGTVGVASDATLSWWPGASAVSHDVYLGTTSPPALIGSTTGSSFDPGPLKLGTTYYWRVDAVEADGTVHTGDIWSFTPLDDVTAPGDTVQGVPDDGDWPGGEPPPMVIDDDSNTKFLHFKGATQPTGFQVTALASQGIVTALTFTTANDSAERDPVAFELSGSNVSINGPYDFIASGEIVDFNQETAWPRFTINETPISFENEVAYDHYQVLFTAVRDAANANSMQIAEVELLGLTRNAWGPDPADGATEISKTATLSWLPGVTAASHDVYFGDSDPPAFIGNQAETSYDPGFLKLGTTYYWRVDEVEADGTKRTGDVWSFTTELGKATQPDPADGATEVEKTPTLSWLPGATAASHDVYFGDSSPPAFISNQTETSYSPGSLDKGKTYYWRIDEVEADGTTKYEGSVWSFTVTSAGR